MMPSLDPYWNPPDAWVFPFAPFSPISAHLRGAPDSGSVIIWLTRDDNGIKPCVTFDNSTVSSSRRISIMFGSEYLAGQFSIDEAIQQASKA
jgi:hypothetical protein